MPRLRGASATDDVLLQLQERGRRLQDIRDRKIRLQHMFIHIVRHLPLRISEVHEGFLSPYCIGADLLCCYEDRRGEYTSFNLPGAYEGSRYVR